MAERNLILRHALSGGNIEGIIQGQFNAPLKSGYKTGVDKLAQMIITQEQLAPQTTPVYVYCSELDRAYYTADRLHRGFSGKGIQSDLRINSLLTERGQGILERRRYEDAITHLLPLLPPDTTLEPKSESIYPHLYVLDNITGVEKHESIQSRLEQFLHEIQLLRGVVIIVGHGISGMNNLKNLMTDGDILGVPTRPYQHFPNLSVVRLEPKGYARYMITGTYGPPNGQAANGDTHNNLAQTSHVGP